MTDLNIDLRIRQRDSQSVVPNKQLGEKLAAPIFDFSSSAPVLDLSNNVDDAHMIDSNESIEQSSKSEPEVHIEHDGDATIKTILNPDGSKTKTTAKNGFMSIENYDSNDRLISGEIIYDDSTSTSILYSYNTEGNLISQKSIYKNSGSNIIRDTEYRYNEFGQRIGEVVKSSEDGKLKTVKNVVFLDIADDKPGKILEKLYDANTQELLETSEITEEQLENGLVKQNIKTTNDTEISKTETVIDEFGNIFYDTQENIDPETNERISFTQEINEYADGKRISSKIIQRKDKLDSPNDMLYSITAKSYREDGSLLSSNYEMKRFDGTGLHSESQYNEQGRIVLDKLELTDVYANTTDNSTTEYEYDTDGTTLKRRVTKGVDEESLPYEKIQVFNENAEQISCDSSKYHLGVKTEEHYEAINSKVPVSTVVYEEDGTTIKDVTVNNFDSNGVLLSQEIKDKDGNIISKHDFSKIDGNFDTSYQEGCGDCYLLAGLNALRESSEGQTLLRQIIDIQQDENGNNLYTIKFPGTQIVRQNLLEVGIAESDIPIKSSYTFTEAELYEKAKLAGSNYSLGDKDVLLLEAAYEQYRKDAQSCLENQGLLVNSSMLYARGVENKEDGDVLDGGWQTDAIFLMTGKSAETVSNQISYEAPICKIDSNYNMTILMAKTEEPEETDEPEDIEEMEVVEDLIEPTAPSAPAASSAPSAPSAPAEPLYSVYKPELLDLNDLFDIIEQDCNDGSLDNFAVSASFNVSTQTVSGRTFKNRSHAFSISKIEGDNVYLKNPWNPTKEFIMTKDEIEMACLDFSIIPLNKSGEAVVELVKSNKPEV